MAKKGRKPKERKGYFYEKEEQAIVQYINSTSETEKNKIFNTVLYPALTTMIESIIRRYKLFVPDEEYDINFSDTISYLLTKISHYRPVIIGYDEVEGEIKDEEKYVFMNEQDFIEKVRNADENDPKYVKVKRYIKNKKEIVEEIKYYEKVEKHYKAYSYCGTVCKNYLCYKCSQYTKKRQRNTSYDEVFEEINNSMDYVVEEDVQEKAFAEELVKGIADEIERIYLTDVELKEEEKIVGRALVTLFRNWEDILPTDGSDKLRKSTILYFLREQTMMLTKEIRDNMKPYKVAYALLKKKMVE